MSYCMKRCRWLSCLILLFPLTLWAAVPVKSMVIFGDSLSDNGNTTHLLKSLRQDENPSYLVKPLKEFILNKMETFADAYHVPQIVLDTGVQIVRNYFDYELAPLLASIIGKVKRVPVLPGEPYWQSHFSNGRVWNEYLAPMLSVDREDDNYFTNKAFGGSWTVTYDYQLTVWNLIRHPIGSIKNLVAGKLIPPSLGLIIQAHLLNHPKLDPDAVYFVFVGGNDYLNFLFFEDNYNPAVMSTYIDNVLNSLSTSVKKLVKSGARHIVVFGIPDVGIAPKFANTTDKPVISQASALHNERLQKRIAKWHKRYPKADFLFINIQKIMKKALDNPSAYGLTNISDACIDVKLPMFNALIGSPFARNYVLSYAQVLQYHDSHFARGEKNYHKCSTPDTYLFWDEIHPTTRAHKYLAFEVCEKMKAHGYEVASCEMST